MRLLSLDLSTHTGFAFFDNDKLIDYGLLETKIEDFDVSFADKSPLYPWNLIQSAGEMADKVAEVFLKYDPRHYNHRKYCTW